MSKTGEPGGKMNRVPSSRRGGPWALQHRGHSEYLLPFAGAMADGLTSEVAIAKGGTSTPPGNLPVPAYKPRRRRMIQPASASDLSKRGTVSGRMSGGRRSTASAEVNT